MITKKTIEEIAAVTMLAGDNTPDTNSTDDDETKQYRNIS